MGANELDDRIRDLVRDVAATAPEPHPYPAERVARAHDDDVVAPGDVHVLSVEVDGRAGPGVRRLARAAVAAAVLAVVSAVAWRALGDDRSDVAGTAGLFDTDGHTQTVVDGERLPAGAEVDPTGSDASTQTPTTVRVAQLEPIDVPEDGDLGTRWLWPPEPAAGGELLERFARLVGWQEDQPTGEVRPVDKITGPAGRTIRIETTTPVGGLVISRVGDVDTLRILPASRPELRLDPPEGTASIDVVVGIGGRTVAWSTGPASVAPLPEEAAAFDRILVIFRDGDGVTIDAAGS